MKLNFKLKPLKSEAIHETGLSGNVVTSFFPLIIFIYIYIYTYFFFPFPAFFQLFNNLNVEHHRQLVDYIQL